MALVSAGASLGGFAGGSVLSRLLVVVSGETRPLTSALRTAQSDVLTFSQKANLLGNSLTRSISLPALAAAGGMVFLNAQFQKSLATIAGLTPVVQSGEETIDSLSTKILDLAKTLPTSPNEIARAFYFAASAGLSAATAMDVVKFSAEGAAVGMGDASDISRVLIAALNNYSAEGLTAASAMDALTAAVREGTAEPAELAVALGRLLPIAHQAGVTFQEVVGSVAALTNLGVPARVATTSLRALFSQLLAPTKQATDTLNQLGLTVEDVQKALRTGPLEAFQLVTNAAKGNEEVIRNLIPQIRGLTAFYGLSGDRLDEYRHIIDETTHSTGDFGRAFAAIQATPAFQFEVGINKLRVAAIQLGAKAIPVFEKIITVISAVGDSLSSLPGWGKTAIVSLLLLAGVAGPLFKLAAAMTEVTKVTKEAGVNITSMTATGKAFGTMALTMGVSTLLAAGSLTSLAHGASDLTTILMAAGFSILAVKSAIMLLQAAAQAGMLGVNALSLGLVSLSGGAATVIAVGIGVVATAIAYLAGQSDRAAKENAQLRDSMKESAQAGLLLKQALDKITSEDLRTQLHALAADLKLLESPTGKVLPELESGTLNELIKTLPLVTDRMTAIGGAANEANVALLAKLVPAMKESQATGRSLAYTLGKSGTSIEEVQGILQDFTGWDKDWSHAAETSVDLINAFRDLSDVQGQLHDSAAASVIGFQYEGEALKSLAAQTGVSVDFLKGKLQEAGTTATEVVGGDYVRQFALAMGASKDLSLQTVQDAQRIQEAFDTLTSSLSENFTVFGDLPKKAGKSIDKYLNRARELSRVAIQEAQDINTLQEAGVPSGLIDQLVTAGPSMVAKFAGATKGQLNSLVAQYELGLAAMDSAILREAAHQEVKGKGMVQGFADAILGSKQLTTQAARELMQSIGAQITSGNIKPAAVRLITNFIAGLDRGPKLAGNKARQVILAFVHEIQGKHNFTKDGQLIVSKVVEGIASKIDLPKQRIRGMVQDAIAGITEKEPAFQQKGRRLTQVVDIGMRETDLTPVGASYIGQVVAGMNSGAGAAYSTATTIAKGIKNAFDLGLKNSPRYASYYMGQKYADEFKEGLNRGVKAISMRTVHIAGPPPTTDTGAWTRGEHSRIERLDVRLDRNRTAREIDWAHRTAGHR